MHQRTSHHSEYACVYDEYLANEHDCESVQGAYGCECAAQKLFQDACVDDAFHHDRADEYESLCHDGEDVNALHSLSTKLQLS